jgi:hypothetical protein
VESMVGLTSRGFVRTKVQKKPLLEEVETLEG